MTGPQYEWRLREIMAGRGIYSTTKLIPLLRERGIRLSSSQVYRLVTEKPERLNLQVLIALTDILGCTADDLIAAVEERSDARTGTDDRIAKESGTDVLRQNGFRPVPAKILAEPTNNDIR